MTPRWSAWSALTMGAVREILRQPITLILTGGMAVGILLLPAVTTQTLGETSTVVRDGALALHLFFGVLLAGLSACHGMTGDLTRGAAATVLSKPVSRTAFLLSRYAALLIVLLVFSLIATFETLVTVRVAQDAFQLEWKLWVPAILALPAGWAVAAAINYVTRRPFPSDAFFAVLIAALAALLLALRMPLPATDAAPGPSLFPPLLPVCALLTLALFVMGGIALALSTRLPPVATVTLCSVIFVLGLMSDYLFGRAADTSVVAGILHAALPNWQHFWLADALHINRDVPWSYVVSVLGYAALYSTGMLSIAIALFQSREVSA
ncbi:MAG: hypothetical protein KBA51_00060 [Kiritimatiellae bacterium]|nr:hypothetical protein [Kiritimatiellia bacterium]